VIDLENRAAPRSVTIAAGHDLVYIPEFRRLLRPRFIARAFTAAEASASEEAFDSATYLASRWAAKEAAYKAVCDLSASRGLTLDGLASFRDYEVVRRPGTPVPALVFHGGPQRVLALLSGDSCVEVSLSLTHEHDYAAAFVVIACAPAAVPLPEIRLPNLRLCEAQS
jgi:holo-[acyl-carrier protein] synthase